MVRYSKKRQMGWLRHVLTFLCVIIFLLGCVVIGYMAWVLATSVTISHFVDGTMFWSYVVITLGFSLFFTGLLGWVGGASESLCLVRMFLVFITISLLVEIGGIISANILEISFKEIIEQGWIEVNQGTRNLIQTELRCCGWNGLEEFAKSNEPIDESCYERISPSISGIVSLKIDSMKEEINISSTRRMKQTPCQETLSSWFEENKITWVTFLAVIAAIQVLCIGITVYILLRVRKLRRKSRSFSKKKLYESSSDESETNADKKYDGSGF